MCRSRSPLRCTCRFYSTAVFGFRICTLGSYRFQAYRQSALIIWLWLRIRFMLYQHTTVRARYHTAVVQYSVIV